MAIGMTVPPTLSVVLATGERIQGGPGPGGGVVPDLQHAARACERRDDGELHEAPGRGLDDLCRVAGRQGHEAVFVASIGLPRVSTCAW